MKLILRTSSCVVSSGPISSGWPVTTLKTPGGTPASAASSASAKAVSGVCSAGLTTMVHPAASAGAALRVIMAAGKFQGVMAAQTPTGSFRTTMRPDACGAMKTSPLTRLASSANHSMKEPAYATSPLASASGLPSSRTISRARCSVLAATSSAQARRTADRSLPDRLRQAGSARCAASMASRTCPRLIAGTVATTSPVAGSSTSIVPDSPMSTQRPST